MPTEVIAAPVLSAPLCEGGGDLPGWGVRLNLGAGQTPLPGYRPIDRKLGTECYPLPADIADESVDEIRASHVLEHFSHTMIGDVLRHWVSKLKPGGRLKIAVPDFEWIAKHYLAGDPVDVQAYLMGGHLDENDRHAATFDRETLEECLLTVGLERVGPWVSEINDCANLPVSLNLMGFKPAGELNTGIKRIQAVVSVPRFGPTMHFAAASKAFGPLGINYEVCQGAFWHQILSEQIEAGIAKGRDFILTLDFDTLFTTQDVAELYRLIYLRPDVDAVMALQMNRGSKAPLMTLKDKQGRNRATANTCEFQGNLTRVATGHFGLTLFRASALTSLPRPWMVPIPGADGRWRDGGKDADGNKIEGKVDADINFWQNWEKNGKTLFLANKVVVGHIVEGAVWPGRDMKPVWQMVSDWQNHGIPAECER